MPRRDHHRGPATTGASRRRGPISLLLAGAVVVYACGDAPTGPGLEPPPPEPTSALAVDGLSVEGLSVSAASLKVCGEPTVVSIIHPEGLDLGRVTVTNDDDDVSVLFETEGDWELLATHLALEDSPSGFPTNRSGLAQPGRFPYTQIHSEGMTFFVVSVPLAELGLAIGDEVLIAAHAEVIDYHDPGDPEDDQVEGGWGDGTAFSRRPKGNVGRYFEHQVQDCAVVAQTVGREGGTVKVGAPGSGERATLDIPPGALAEPVVITVRAIPLSEISLPGSAGLAFIEGTAYDFGPDGLTFLAPVLLTIGYDEVDLGGAPESSLAMFRVADDVELLAGSTVDEAANEVSALVDHFTVYVTAIDDGIAMTVEETVGVTDEVAIHVLSTLRAQVAEAIGVGDEVTITVRPAPRSNVAESVGVTDEVTINVLTTLRPQVAEAIGVGDEVTITIRPVPRASVAESVGITDQVAITVRTPQQSTVAESVGVTDQVTINVLSSIAADVSEAIGIVDDVTITVVPGEPSATADLAVPVATAPTTPVSPGTPAQVQAYVQNLGPDAVTDARAIYRAFGDVVAGTLETGCTETASPGDGDVEIVCDVGALAVSGVVLAPRAFFVPQSDGTVTVRAVAASSALDPNPSNDAYETQFTAGTGADLQVVRVDDAPDPVTEGGDVAYDVTVRSNTSGVTVDGATLQLLFTGGDATFSSADAGCTEIAGGVECALPSLAPFTSHVAHVVMTLPTEGQTVTAEATVSAPAGIIELNPSNNVGSAQTTVVARPPAQLQFGDIIESATTTPGDTTWFSFEGVPGEIARVQVWMTQDLGQSVQLVIENPAGNEIYPDGIPRGRATDNSSAYFVFPMLDFGAATTWRIGLRAFNTGPYRLGLGSGEGRMDESYGTAGTGVAYGPNSNDANPFFDWDWVEDEVTVLGERAMVRFDGNGELDGTFGSAGVVDVNTALGSGRWGQALAIQPDGKIVVAARQLISPYPWIVGRFEATGVLDPTFGTGGITTIPMGTRSSSRPLGVAFQQNGADLDIVVGGEVGELQERVGIVRLNPDGSLDAGFGGGDGIVFESRGMTPRKMVLQSDGSILMHGWDDLLRYTPDGVLDTSFGTGGILDYAIPGNAMAIDVLPDDRLIVTGLDIGNAFVMRLTADGARDATFSGAGYQTYDFGFTNERFQAATLDGTGGLIAVGYIVVAGGDYEWLVTRMSLDGVPDPDFAISGYLTEIRTDNALAVRMDSGGRIVVGGQDRNTIRGIELTRHLPN